MSAHATETEDSQTGIPQDERFMKGISRAVPHPPAAKPDKNDVYHTTIE